jgi:hypothetical protein
MTRFRPGDRVRHVEVPFQTGPVDLVEGQTIWVDLDNNASIRLKAAHAGQMVASTLLRI